MKNLEIHVITDGKQTVEELTKQILRFHEEADYIHIRERTKTASELMEIVSILITGGVPKKKIVINDRVDAAILNDLFNIHLPGHSFSIEKVRKLRPSLRIGRSVHSLQEAIEAEEAGADYLLFGHVFTTNSKAGLAPRGIPQFAEICERIEIPVIAIGGMTPETVQKLSGLKAGGVAVMSYVMSNSEPRHALREIKKSLTEVKSNEKAL
ncbi:thiazole tautomerase TenI [uncultured Metabacillus sp.]|uniref:thiazole tautomerase TenI n=1 Tax=uncultured Metabacillus sp. TaxID=2860135 RepID=UPI002603D56E|nr:thiazole tautomerase TenI [uncultured Metabacillus sp.]